MKILECYRCGAQLGESDQVCPRCGIERNENIPNYPRMGGGWFMVMWVLFIVFIIMLAITWFTM